VEVKSERKTGEKAKLTQKKKKVGGDENRRADGTNK